MNLVLEKDKLRKSLLNDLIGGGLCILGLSSSFN